jgi:hypothetical protein
MSDEFLLGADDMIKRFRNIANNLPGEAKRALYEEAQVIMIDAKRMTPVEYGTLKGSGRVATPVVNAREISVQLSFGGPAAGYAIYVHENLQANHPRGGQAKFLETAVLNAASFLPQRLVSRIALNRLL